jgi:hypothetical protein
MKNTVYVVLFVLTFILASLSAHAQGNNSFFGANPSGGGGSSGSSSASSSSSDNQDYSKDMPEDNNPNAVLPGLNETTPAKPKDPTDFTGDEKRMKQKYKSNIANANQLISKGTNMMKQAHDNVNSPGYKKGKILKEIGEKSLAELNASNPFPDQKKK